MQEIELKFQVPAGQLAGVQSAMLALPQASAKPLAMHAAYFDTPDSRLAACRMALRVRREGDDWVQTFKAGGADAMTRLEDNQPLPPGGPAFRDGSPVAELSLHTEAAVQAALTRALGRAAGDPLPRASLGVVYDTVFDRYTALLHGQHGSVQLCLDLGEVRAGSLSEPLCELELELQSGTPLAVIDAARLWVDAHGLWLDVQSKAYRGTRLAQAAQAGEQAPACRPVAVETLPIWAALGEPVAEAADAWLRATLNTTLDMAAGNLSEVAWARPGWAHAAQAWRQALHQLGELSKGSRALRQSLPADCWHLGDQLIEALHATPSAALAQSAQATHWTLDVLAAISRLPAVRA